MLQLFTNNASATLRGTLPASGADTPVLVATGTGMLFPPVAQFASYFLATLSAPSAPGVTEIVKCYAADRAGDSLSCSRAQEGTTARAWGLDAKIEVRLTAGTVNRFVTLSDEAALGSNSIAVGNYSVALGGDASAYGKEASANSSNSAAFGAQAIAYAESSLALCRGRARAQYSIAAGQGGFADRERQVSLAGHLMLRSERTVAGSGSWYNSGSESGWASAFLELGTPPSWAAATLYKDGDVVQPTTPNGLQYRLFFDTDLYKSAVLPNKITSPASEPAWSTNIFSTPPAINPIDANHVWRASNLAVGVDEQIPPNVVFYPSEIGFICFTHAGVTNAPFVSIGTAANPTLLVDNQQLSGITGATQRHVFTGFKDGITNLRIKLVTAATGSGARFHGRFYVKGFFIATQG